MQKMVSLDFCFIHFIVVDFILICIELKLSGLGKHPFLSLFNSTQKLIICTFCIIYFYYYYYLKFKFPHYHTKGS